MRIQQGWSLEGGRRAVGFNLMFGRELLRSLLFGVNVFRDNEGEEKNRIEGNDM